MVRPIDSALRLSVQRGLLGQLGESLLGVCVDLEEDWIILTFYVAPAISEDELEDLRLAGTYVVADFSDFRIDERFIEVTDSSQPLATAGTWCFLRRGLTTTRRIEFRYQLRLRGGADGGLAAYSYQPKTGDEIFLSEGRRARVLSVTPLELSDESSDNSIYGVLEIEPVAPT